MQITLTLPIEPMPAPRMDGAKRRFKPTAYRNWTTEAVRLIQAQLTETFGKEYVEVWITAYRTLEAAAKTSLPVPRGDCDNYEKAILDALTQSEIWYDDQQVADLHTRKRWSERGQPGYIEVRIATSDVTVPAGPPKPERAPRKLSAKKSKPL